MRISPTPAWSVSRAVVFTVSPSAVKSLASPSPRAPTNDRPVCTPMPTGTHGSDPSFSGLLEQVPCSGNRGCRVLAPCEARDEERHRGVAHELVDDAVPVVDHLCRRPVEAGQQPRELLRRHPLGHRRRSANVGEEHGDVDLGSAWMLVDGAGAPFAEPSIQRRRAIANRPHQETSGPPERGVAELAARRRGKRAPHPSHAVETRVAAREHLLPHFVDRQLRHQPGTLRRVSTAFRRPSRSRAFAPLPAGRARPPRPHPGRKAGRDPRPPQARRARRRS
jgi:hypothetical protein